MDLNNRTLKNNPRLATIFHFCRSRAAKIIGRGVEVGLLLLSRVESGYYYYHRRGVGQLLLSRAESESGYYYYRERSHAIIIIESGVGVGILLLSGVESGYYYPD